METQWTSAPLDVLVEILDSRRIPVNATERESRIAGKSPTSLFPYFGASGQVGLIDDYLFDEPLILLGEDGVPFLDRLRNKAYIVDGKCWVNNHAHVLRAISAAVDRRYLTGYLNTVDYTSLVSGSTRLKLTQEAMRSISVPLAPRLEQRRIADKLDALLVRIDACRQRIDRVPTVLKRFRQSVLSAATNGELTREWREARNLNGRWPIVKLKNVATDFSYGSSTKSSKTGLTPVLRMGNIQDGLIDWGELVYTSDTLEVEKYRLTPGDVLFNRTNSPELVGKTAVFQGEREAIFAGYLIRVRCEEHLLPAYLNYCLGSPAGRDYCWRVKSDGVSQSNINAKKLSDFSFGLPDVSEQIEIVRRVEDLLAFNRALGARLMRVSQAVKTLTPSTLAKAFRGELVPQDPKDESASALLSRIKIQLTKRESTSPLPRSNSIARRHPVKRVDQSTIKKAILSLPSESLTFEQISAAVPANYEELKDALFGLLGGSTPALTQVFDDDAKIMLFKRVKT